MKKHIIKNKKLECKSSNTLDKCYWGERYILSEEEKKDIKNHVRSFYYEEFEKPYDIKRRLDFFFGHRKGISYVHITVR